jgi:hypothetical protein
MYRTWYFDRGFLVTRVGRVSCVYNDKLNSLFPGSFQEQMVYCRRISNMIGRVHFVSHICDTHDVSGVICGPTLFHVIVIALMNYFYLYTLRY